MQAQIHGYPSQVPGLLSQKTEDGIVIVSPSKGQLRVLNPIGSVIWMMLDGSKSIKELEKELCQRYKDIDPQQISYDLFKFLQELMNRGLILGIES
ncbi:MAG: PqqD family protein [Ardenticatenaceae bacterium]|nr:PqqD family protein [Ardenticatenaceae bacterium]